jgi:hypothetical protein
VHQEPLEIDVSRPVNMMQLQNLRWVGPPNYELKLGLGELRENCRAMANGRFLCHYIPSVLSTHDRREFFRTSLAVARNNASSTRRLKNVGGGVHTLTKAGTQSVYARPRKLVALRDAKEGVFGFEGIGRGGGCHACSFNRERPQHYKELESLCESLSLLAREQEPEIWQKQMNLTVAYRRLMIGESIWSQGVCNLCFPMTTHSDSGNVPASMSAMVISGDFDGGPLIFPAFSLAVFLQPGDVLLYDGHAHHGVGPFTGVRLTTVLYLNSAVLRCPCDI